MKKYLPFLIIFVFYMVFSIFVNFAEAENATKGNDNCSFYRDLYNIVLKNGKQDEIIRARKLMNQYCNQNSPNPPPFSSPISPIQKKPLPTLQPTPLPTNCPHIVKPLCNTNETLIPRYDQKGCVISYMCVSFRSGKSDKCPQPLKPLNCSENLVPIVENGCVVRYFCQPKNNTSQNCPAINWDIKCPPSQNKKIYSKDSNGCYYVKCTASQPEVINNFQKPKSDPIKCNEYSLRYYKEQKDYLKKLAQYYCGGTLNIK